MHRTDSLGWSAALLRPFLAHLARMGVGPMKVALIGRSLARGPFRICCMQRMACGRDASDPANRPRRVFHPSIEHGASLMSSKQSPAERHAPDSTPSFTCHRGANRQDVPDLFTTIQPLRFSFRPNRWEANAIGPSTGCESEHSHNAYKNVTSTFSVASLGLECRALSTIPPRAGQLGVKAPSASMRSVFA